MAGKQTREADAPEAPDWSGLLDALERRDTVREASRPLSTVETAAVGFGRWRTIVGGLLFFAALGTGAVLAFAELQAKPTTAEVDVQIETKVAPVRVKADAAEAEVDTVGDTVSDIKATQARQGEVQSYLLEQMVWQGKVVQHIAQKKSRHDIPQKPPTLEAKEQKLLGAIP